MASEVIPKFEDELRARSAKILVVDDDLRDLRITRLTLEGQGYEVFTCVAFDAALQCLEAVKLDFVLVCQGTRAFEGRQVLERAIQLNRHTPVLVLTRCIDMRCYLEAMQLGAIDYLEKPVPPSDLLRFVRAHVLAGQFRLRQSAV